MQDVPPVQIPVKKEEHCICLQSIKTKTLRPDAFFHAEVDRRYEMLHREVSYRQAKILSIEHHQFYDQDNQLWVTSIKAILDKPALCEQVTEHNIADNSFKFHEFLNKEGIEFKPNASFTTLICKEKDMFDIGVKWGAYKVINGCPNH